MTATRGPVPKRTSERRRRNKVPGETSVARQGAVVIPRLPPGLHLQARKWYQSLAESGQSEFYEPSDWRDAVIAAIALDDWLETKTAAKLTAWRDMAKELHTTENARRRARMEVERTAVEEKPAEIADYRARLAK